MFELQHVNVKKQSGGSDREREGEAADSERPNSTAPAMLCNDSHLD